MSTSNSNEKICQFEKIYLYNSNENKQIEGKLRIATTGLGWKSNISNKIITINRDFLKKFYFVRVCNFYELQVLYFNNNETSFIRLNGFKNSDYLNLKDLFKKHYNNVNFERKELSVKGWNWGQTEFDNNNNLVFLVDNLPSFELNLLNLTNTNLVAKNEVSLEFSNLEAQNISKRKHDDDLVEIRFYVPNHHKNTKTDNDMEAKETEENQEPDELTKEEEEEKNQAHIFYETVKARAGLVISGEAMCLFQEILLLTPRGRYDIDMFETFFRLRGKTYDYKVLYNSVNKIIIVPRNDDKNILVVIGVEPPIRQGQTKYPFLVMEMSKNSEISLELNVNQELVENNESNLNKSYEGPLYEVIGDIFSKLTQIQPVKPIDNEFKSYHGFCSIKCSIKANEGYLYLLKECLIFLPKNTLLINYHEIGQIIFQRVNNKGGSYISTQRTFDLRINLKNGNQVQISSINKEEHSLIEAFLRLKKIKFKDELNDDISTNNASQNNSILAQLDVDDDDDDEEEDADYNESGDEDMELDADSGVEEEISHDSNSDE